MTEWTFPNAATQIQFNALTADGPVNYTWSASPSGNSGSGSFTQATAGLVTVAGLSIAAGDVVTLSIMPTNLRRFYMSYGTNPILTNVMQWGSVSWSSMQNAFLGCNNLQISATDIPNLTGVTNMFSMFKFCHILNGPSNINDWNIANVTDTSYMFNYAHVFNQNLSDWDTSSITTMKEMFFQAMEFNQDISNWNLDSVVDLSLMFVNAFEFNQDIGNWNTSAVTDMSLMFSGASAFNQDISHWDTAGVTNMHGMLNTATSFNKNLGGWILHPNVDLTSMLNNGGMDCDNYSATLVGWEANNPTVTNRNLGAFNRNYGTSAVAARTILVNTRGWTINDSTKGDICDASLSTLDYDLENQISIYPNPVRDYLTVNYNTNQAYDIAVYNSLGKLLTTYEKAKSNFQVPVEHLANGLYFISVKDESGKKATLKFVKNN